VKRKSGGDEGEGSKGRTRGEREKREEDGGLLSNHFLSFVDTIHTTADERYSGNNTTVMACGGKNIVCMRDRGGRLIQGENFSPTALDAITKVANIPGKIGEGVEISHANLFIYMLVAGSIFLSLS
jgi:hypothetical protein